MNDSRLLRLGGLAMLIGAATFVVHIVARSVITAGHSTATAATLPAWVPVNALGVIGAVLVLLGLPILYAPMEGSSGRVGVTGVILMSLGWLFFGVFLSLFALLVAPWLAEKAPALIAGDALPTALVSALVIALCVQVAGAVLLAIPFVRRQEAPRWVGYVLLGSALMTLIGNLIAPSGPAASLVINLISNSGAILLAIALGSLGARAWLVRGARPS